MHSSHTRGSQLSTVPSDTSNRPRESFESDWDMIGGGEDGGGGGAAGGMLSGMLTLQDSNYNSNSGGSGASRVHGAPLYQWEVRACMHVL